MKIYCFNFPFFGGGESYKMEGRRKKILPIHSFTRSNVLHFPSPLTPTVMPVPVFNLGIVEVDTTPTTLRKQKSRGIA